MRLIKIGDTLWRWRRGSPQELRAAQDRITQFEHDLAAHRDRVERAELWLDKIRTEIEQQFPRGGHNAPRRLECFFTVQQKPGI
jgi:hypothetical protein